MGRKRYKPRDPVVTSHIMRAIRGRDNKAERLLRSELWQRGLRYRLYAKTLPGKPDIVFRSARVAVFVDGDFWHGRRFLEGGRRALRAMFRPEKRDWWERKIRGNVDVHGRISSYTRGCRCEKCREAWRDYQREYRSR